MLLLIKEETITKNLKKLEGFTMIFMGEWSNWRISRIS
jgi:hypothetical protein